ncbi:MAG: hypothetical protein JOY78_20325 [Pseudonocardia sp.]|nr:hypothetical protein [Pseudonocardia sp.]
MGGIERARWSPDDQLISAILAGTGAKMSALGDSDRAWVVAGLTLAGHTAEDIADRMACSLRLVRSIRAMDMTQLCLHMHIESRNFTDELRLARADARSARGELAATNAELTRVRAQLNRLIDAQITAGAVFGCGHPRDRYNTYVHEPTGKLHCRTCHRKRQQRHRDERRAAAQIDNTDSDDIVLTEVVTA